MAGSGDDSRRQGVELGDLELDEDDYPVTTEELLDAHGDEEIELPNGSTTLEEVLEPEETESQEFEDADAVREMVMTMVGDEAVGSKGYSDRGGTAAGQDPQDDTESF